jgi:hypothetical protein
MHMYNNHSISVYSFSEFPVDRFLEHFLQVLIWSKIRALLKIFDWHSANYLHSDVPVRVFVPFNALKKALPSKL